MESRDHLRRRGAPRHAESQQPRLRRRPHPGDGGVDWRRGAADRDGVRAQLGGRIRQRTPGKLTKLGAMATRTPQEWISDYPLLTRLVALQETLWLKPDLPGAEEGLAHVG